MSPKYILTVNASRIAQLAHDMGLAGNREDWDRAIDYAQRIEKLSQECLNVANEAKAEEV